MQPSVASRVTARDGFVAYVGRRTLETGRALADVRTWAPLLVVQMRRLGVDSVPIALFIAVFTGIVLSLLSSYIFTGTVPLYFVGALVGKTVQSIRVVGNVGLGILGDPTRGDNQNDVLLYGISVARAVREGVEVVGELNGRANTRGGTPPVGTESRAALRAGGRLTRGTVRLDIGVLLGITSRDPSFGVTAGATWVFKGFTLP